MLGPELVRLTIYGLDMGHVSDACTLAAILLWFATWLDGQGGIGINESTYRFRNLAEVPNSIVIDNMCRAFRVQVVTEAQLLAMCELVLYVGPQVVLLARRRHNKHEHSGLDSANLHPAMLGHATKCNVQSFIV